MQEDTGFYELRSYHLKPGMRQRYLDLLVPRLAFYRSVMGPCVGHFAGEEDADIVVTLWRYKDKEDREARRAQLDADADWAVFRSQVGPLIEKLESTFLFSTPGSLPVWPSGPVQIPPKN